MSDKDGTTSFIGTSRTEVQPFVNRKRKSEPYIFGSDIEPEHFVVDKISKKESPQSESENANNSIHHPCASSVSIQELIAKVNIVRKSGLTFEYESLRVEPPAGTFNISKLKANQSKNRYSDILCFDHSRVILPNVGADLIQSYINANFVDGYKHKNAFICTQGPLPNTCTDFWRMVWHNHSRVIVMTTRTVERSRVKCAQYWPNDKKGSKKFEELMVTHERSSENQNFIETQLILRNTHTEECRMVTHLQFMSWPDHGVPQASPCLEFLFRVRSIQEASTKEMGSFWLGHPHGPPIVVHCSAGIGRTGTFITVDVCLRQLEDIGTVDVKETVRRIRSQRAFSIQVPDQYIFCHQAIIEHAQSGEIVSDKRKETTL